MRGFAQIMPMAGRGSRFSRGGVHVPKPLIELAGRPFFWWATESVRRAAPVRELVYVVLQEHIVEHRIDEIILGYYPDAKIVALPDITSGAAETAFLGLDAVSEGGPIAVNDCDHGFICPALAGAYDALSGQATAGLLCFRSDNPAYSYIRLDEQDEVIGTVEKQVASPFAIAGCYLFADAQVFADAYRAYQDECPYDELFVSGLYNILAGQGARIVKAEMAEHRSFGTPEELALVTPDRFARFAGWVEEA